MLRAIDTGDATRDEVLRRVVFGATLGATRREGARADRHDLRVGHQELVVDDLEDRLVARGRALLRAGHVAARLANEAGVQVGADRVRAVPADRVRLEVRRRHRAAEEPEARRRADTERVVGGDHVVVTRRGHVDAAREHAVQELREDLAALVDRHRADLLVRVVRAIGVEAAEQGVLSAGELEPDAGGVGRDAPAVARHVTRRAAATVRALRGGERVGERDVALQAERRVQAVRVEVGKAVGQRAEDLGVVSCLDGRLLRTRTHAHQKKCTGRHPQQVAHRTAH